MQLNSYYIKYDLTVAAEQEMKRRDSKSVLIRDWVYMLLSAGQLVKMVTQIKHKKNVKK